MTRNGPGPDPLEASLEARGITLDDAVAAGFTVQTRGGGRVLEADYEHPDGTTARRVFVPDGDRGVWQWAKGAKAKGAVLTLAGNPGRATTVLITEGESDGIAARRALEGHPIAIVSIPGAGMVGDDLADLIAPDATVVIASDADDAGDKMAAALQRVLWDQPDLRRLRPNVDGVPEPDLRDVIEAGGPDVLAELVAGAPAMPPANVRDQPGPFRFQTAVAFASTLEDTGPPLLGDTDDALIVNGSDVIIYGDGGAGKTTLQIDAAFHLAAGDDWLIWHVPRPMTVLIIENEGPRAPFRRKLSRKLDGWTGGQIHPDRLLVLEEPWATLTLDQPDHRVELARAVRDHNVDMVMIGPLTAAGMNEAGTLQDVRAFATWLADVRTRSGRPFVFWLPHHENKRGSISGSWEGTCDALLKVSAQGNGYTRVLVQKARWSSTYHGQTLVLQWADNAGFRVMEKPVTTDEEAVAAILEHAAHNPGAGWSTIEKAIPGKATRLRELRDRLLAERQIVNVVKVDGKTTITHEIRPRTKTAIYLPDAVELRDQAEPDAGDVDHWQTMIDEEAHP